MYSTYSEGKSVVAERFIRTLKNEIFKHMTAISESVFILMCQMIFLINTTTHFIELLKLNQLMLHLILMLNTMKILIEKISNLKLVIASEYHKNIFAKGYTQNWSEVFVISKLKNTVLWTYNSSDLSGKLIDGAFYEIELQKTNQQEESILP